MTSETEKSIDRKWWKMKRVYVSLAAAFALGAFLGLNVLCPGHIKTTTYAVTSTSSSSAVGSLDAASTDDGVQTNDSVQMDTAPLAIKAVGLDPSVYADPGYDPADVKAAPNSHLYPAEMTVTTELLAWDQAKFQL